MADVEPRWWREFEHDRATQLRERLAQRAESLLAQQAANDRALAEALPHLREMVAQIASALIDTSELSYRDFATLRSLALALAHRFEVFQNELAVFDA